MISKLPEGADYANLLAIPGLEPIVATKILSETRGITRVRSPAAFAAASSGSVTCARGPTGRG